jgi:PAS domain S-box-containing protein
MSKESTRAEEALTSSEQELRLLVDAIPTLVWRAAPDGNFEYVNKRMLEYLGAALSEVIGWGWMDKVHPDDIAFKVRTWLQNLESGSPHDAACRIRGADGRYRWFEARGEPLRANDGKVLSWYGVLIDIDDRRKAEEALRESEYKLRQIIDTVPGLIWSTGSDGEPTHVGQRLLDYSGMRFEDFKQVGWKAFVHPDDFPQTAKAYYQAIQTETSYHGVVRLRRADGEFRWHHARCEPLRDRQGRIIQWYGLCVEIDEAQLQAILNVLPAFTWYAAPSGALTFVNKRTADYLGLAKDHPLRFGIDIGAQWDDWVQLLHPDDHEGSRKVWSTCLRTGEAGEYSFRVRNAQGGYRWFLSRSEPLRASDETLLQWVGVNLDIEELKCAEQALRRSEAYLAEAQRLSHTGSFGWTPSTGELHWSDETYRILEYDPSIKPTIERVLQRIHPDDLAMTRQLLDETSLGEKDFDNTHRLLMPDGSVKFVHVLSYVLKDATGNLEIVGALMDVTERKKAEDLLRRSEAHLAEAQKLSHTGAVAYNGTAILFASEETYHIWGFDPAQGLPSREVVFQRVHPGDRDWLNAEVRRAVGEKRRFSTAYRILLPDGTVKHLETIGQPLFSANGKLVEIFATQTDVTERKRAEEALRESQAKFRDYAESASDWFWEIGPDYKFTMLTENAFGSNAADRIGTACWDRALDLRTEPEKWRLLRATLDSRKPFRDFVYCSIGGNGSPMYVKASGKPVFDGDGEFRGYRGAGADVTEQEQLNRELERRQAYLAQAQRLSHIGTWAVNETTTLYFSEESYRIWGFDPQQGLPNNEALRQRTHPDDWGKVYEEALQAWRQKRDYGSEFRIVLPDGTVKYLDATSHPVFSVDGELVEVVGTHVDITERKRAEAEHERLRQLESDLAHMNRVGMMGELAASLAHEITQPIAAGRNNARAALNFLDQQPPDLGEVREALGCAVGDADRAGQIVDRIRDHIKKAPPRKHRFDLNEAINEVIVLARSAIAENGVSVQTRLSEGLAPVEGDRVQLQQVILNLVLNAAEAMSVIDRGARQLLISTDQGGANGVLVAVRDSGPGIDPEHIERVFDAFYTTKPSGVGMGLSICRSIIEAHSGRLWADANELGGAAFQFTLPGAEELMNSLHVAHQNGAPHEDSA